MTRILMVCLGNICRSPMADGLLRRKVKEHNLAVYVDSAGTANYHIGKKPDSRMCQTAKENQTNIEDLRARQFTQEDFSAFDKIYAMDQENYRNILKLARNSNDELKVELILNETFPGENRAVPDPYYGTKEDFQEVYNLLDHATEVVISKIKNGTIR
ncbi:MAG: low molecular weight protein-tyrosine-phosphatase [Crocinitomicaceae bacterium]|jgi:protein-tyrosine phosphatase